MHYRIIELKSHHEAAQLKDFLELNFIPCTIGQYTPISKSIEDENVLYFISFPNEYLNDFNKVNKNKNPSKLLRIEEVKKERRSLLMKYFLIPYSILVSLICIKFYHSNNFGISEKNFTYKWSTDNKIMDVVNKNTKNIFASYHDKNYDNNWEKIVTYNKGRKIFEANDLNENGILENFLFYNKEGNVVRIETDWNQDGLIDTMDITLENKKKIILIDENQNGTLEVLNARDTITK